MFQQRVHGPLSRLFCGIGLIEKTAWTWKMPTKKRQTQKDFIQGVGNLLSLDELALIPDDLFNLGLRLSFFGTSTWNGLRLPKMKDQHLESLLWLRVFQRLCFTALFTPKSQKPMLHKNILNLSSPQVLEPSIPCRAACERTFQHPRPAEPIKPSAPQSPSNPTHRKAISPSFQDP